MEIEYWPRSLAFFMTSSSSHARLVSNACAYISIFDAALHNLWYYCVRLSSPPTNLDRLLSLQKSALRLIHFTPYRSHVIPLFTQYNILPLNFQYCKSAVFTIMRDVSNKFLPANISTLFLHPTKVKTIILGFQRLVVLKLNIPGQIS